nr:fibronectin type III domain-containing protein 4 isoform X2 [Macaca mulatta]XP_045225518.1 fibronectin type III domain-containing protein 4 isoform X1 [Macaca fascicularis]
MGGAPRGLGVRGREGNDGGENPSWAGRARASRPGCGGASGASAAEGGGWLSGTVTSRCRGGRRPPHCLPHRGPRPASGQRPLLPDRLRGPPEPWGFRRPAPARPAARPRATRLAGPAPGWGRGSATESGDGPPSGHRAAPGGLTNREDRRRSPAWMSSGCHSAPPSGLGGDMASLMPLSPYLSPTVLLLVSCDLGFLRADRPPSPVNVTVTHLRANSATVSWDVPEGNIVIGYSISQQRQNGPGQRVIREVNTTTRACALWGLAEDSDYTVQVRSIGLRGESPPGPRVHFRTLKGSDRLPSNSSSPGDITVEGLDGERPLQTGEVVIIVVVLLMWAEKITIYQHHRRLSEETHPEERCTNNWGWGWGQGEPKMVICLRLPEGNDTPTISGLVPILFPL